MEKSISPADCMGPSCLRHASYSTVRIRRVIP